jgi:hypothetical protein
MGKVFLLCGAIIVSQILIWRAVVAVQNEIVSLEYLVQQPPCGSSPCHVVIDRQ